MISGMVLEEARGKEHEFASNIIWCEDKFSVCRHIAEFWNTISNIALFAAGLFGLARGVEQGVPWRYLICYLFVMILSVGSFIFHAALNRIGQLLDDGPMMLLVAQALFCLKAESTSSMHRKIGCGVGIYSMVIVVSTIYHVLDEALLFQVLFALFVTAAILLTLRRLPSSPRPRRHIKGGLAMGHTMAHALYYCTLAFLLWNADNQWCHQWRRLRARWGFPLTVLSQFHAWWHVLNAVGLSWFIAGLVLADRKHGPQFKAERRWVCIPVLTRLDAAKKD